MNTFKSMLFVFMILRPFDMSKLEVQGVTDLIFVVDFTQTFTEEHLQIIQSWIINITESFSMHNFSVGVITYNAIIIHVGVVESSGSIHVIGSSSGETYVKNQLENTIPLQPLTSRSHFENQVRNISYPMNISNINPLRFALDHLQASSQPHHNKIIVLLAPDTLFSNRTSVLAIARRRKSLGVTIFIVSLNRYSQDELQLITESISPSRFIFQPNNILQLWKTTELIQNYISLILDPTPTPPTNTTTVLVLNKTKTILQEIEDFYNETNKENVSVSQVEEISNKFNSLIVDVSNLSSDSVALQKARNIPKVFSNILRRIIFPSNSTKNIQLKTETFSIQVALVETNSSFHYNSSNGEGGGVSIPADVLEKAAFAENQNKDIIVVIIQYFDDTLFPSEEYVSNVYSVDLGRNVTTYLSDLLNPVEIMFPQTIDKNSSKSISTRFSKSSLNLTCVYWDFKVRGWKTDGCTLSIETPFTCECTHTTNFALIVRPDLPANIALNVVSIIGFILSIVGILATLIIHVIFKELRKKRPSLIVMHICFNLCVGYIIFLAGVEHAKWNKDLCIATAFFLHVFFLAAWGWMTVYSYDLYLSLVKIFGGKKSKFLRISGGTTYGVSILISVITAAAGLSKNDYLARDICWLDQTPLLLGFLLPICILLCFNIVVFVLVFRKIFGQAKKFKSSAIDKSVKQQFIVSVTMICFTGLAWIFAFLLLASNLFDNREYELLFSWLFVIFNTTQGFGIFFFTAVKRKDTRNLWLIPLQSRFSAISSTVFDSSRKKYLSNESTSTKQTSQDASTQTNENPIESSKEL